MYVITYFLRNGGLSSDVYYKEVQAFTDEIFLEAEKLLENEIKQYQAYLLKSRKHFYTFREHVLELLVLGTLWHVYSGDAPELESTPRRILTGLSRLRQQGGSIKPGIDFLRGILSTMFLSPDLYDHLVALDPSSKHLMTLIRWLEATGEFNREVARLKSWKKFLDTLTDTAVKDFLVRVLTLAGWFQLRSEDVLGKYTSNVEKFLNEVRPDHYWREDVIFCGRRRVEYHLNMVGAVIMNRAFRKEFLNKQKKVVVLPGCMRLCPENSCKARSAGPGLQCTGCTPQCTVNRLTASGRKQGFSVLMIPHESSISARQDEGPIFDSNTGVVGVACVLNLISGGWMLQDMGVPAQCVLLDYCGCRNHWHKEGFPTEINEKVLFEVLGIADHPEQEGAARGNQRFPF